MVCRIYIFQSPITKTKFLKPHGDYEIGFYDWHNYIYIYIFVRKLANASIYEVMICRYRDSHTIDLATVQGTGTNRGQGRSGV